MEASTQIDFKTLESNIKTIHGECYTLLGGQAHAKVVDSADLKQFSSEAGYKLKALNYNNPGSDLTDCNTWLVNTDTPLKMVRKYPNFRKLKISPSTAIDQLKHYDEWKKENGLIDFTDMLTEVLKQRLIPEQNILMVDEFQDLTYLQNKIFNMWAEEMDHVTIAGDPLQSIYGFWGGSPEYFDQFQGELEVLPESHRLTPEIWNYAVELAHSHGMQTPDIETSQRRGVIKQLRYRDYLANFELLEGIQGNTAFHLVRSNYQAYAIALRMAENGILWNGLYEWSKTELSALNAILLARNAQRLEKEHIEALVDNYPAKYFNFEGTKQALKATIDKTRTSDYQHKFMTPQLYQILKSPDPAAYMYNPGKLKAAKINNALVRYSRPLSRDDIYTTLTTIHGSKGLEAEKVFLHTGITQTIQKSKRIDPAAEARVFYVGISRARNELYVVKDKGSNNYKLPSVVA
jgi:superfamily I DNA/RNA helicase